MSTPKIILVIDTPGSDSDLIIQDLADNCNLVNHKVITAGEPLGSVEFEATALFFKLAHNRELLDQIEAFRNYIESHDLSVNRVLAILNSKMVKEQENLAQWFEAAIHFSDYVLLTRIKEVPHDFVQKFKQIFEEEKCYPCLFEGIKDTKVKNPQLALDKEPRRMTHIFDDIDVFDEMDLDEDNLPDKPFVIERNTDPFLKINDEGKRLIILPKICD